MAKTETKLTRDQVEAAYAKLQDAKDVFAQAIAEFGQVYNCDTVGLDYWAEGLEDTMYEIYDDIENTFNE